MRVRKLGAADMALILALIGIGLAAWGLIALNRETHARVNGVKHDQLISAESSLTSCETRNAQAETNAANAAVALLIFRDVETFLAANPELPGSAALSQRLHEATDAPVKPAPPEPDCVKLYQPRIDQLKAQGAQ